MTRAARRLHAYLETCLARAARGGRYWLRLPLVAFMKATGYAERTARAAWKDVREQFESRLVRKERSNVSMIALRGTLSPCSRLPLVGNSTSLREKNSYEHAPRAARRKLQSQSIPNDRTAAVRDPLHRLAAWLARKLGSCHWETCRVGFNVGFAHAFAARALAIGYDRQTIEAAYHAALRDEHTVATDVGVKNWSPFRVMGIAMRKLATRAPDFDRTSYEPHKPSPQVLPLSIADALTAFCASMPIDPETSYQPYARAA